MQRTDSPQNWLLSDIHLCSEMISNQPEVCKGQKPNLSRAINYSEGRLQSIPGFKWDIALTLGDIAAVPVKAEGLEFHKQIEAAKSHDRSMFYSLAGNHDADFKQS